MARRSRAYTQEELAEARLLATLPIDRSQWDDSTIFRIATLRTFALFFCPAMSSLRGRGQAIERACRDHEELQIRISRRSLNSLSGGNPVTLDAILRVDRALTAIANSAIRKVRRLTTVGIDDKSAPLKMSDKSVVPSYYWVNRQLLREFRTHFEVRRKDLADLLFGVSEFDNIFNFLEDGEKIKGVGYDFRITRYLADRIYFTLEQLFNALTHYHSEPFSMMPAQAAFFDASHTAGQGSGKRTKALPISRGNAMNEMPEQEARKIKQRVDSFARRRPSSTVEEHQSGRRRADPDRTT